MDKYLICIFRYMLAVLLLAIWSLPSKTKFGLHGLFYQLVKLSTWKIRKSYILTD